MGSESEYYKAHKDFMDYLEQRHDWEKYYRTWLNRVVYEVNQRHFHRAFAEIHLLTDDIKKRHQEKYLYISNMGMGVFYNGRYQPEKGERFFRRALQGINADKDPVAMFNVYLSLAQSLSFKRPADAMACWAIAVSLPIRWTTARVSTAILPSTTASASISPTSSMQPTFSR